MALERVFKCPRTLRRLHSGPIGKLLEGFCDWLLERGFSRWSIRTHLSNLSHLNEYFGGPTDSPRATVTAKDVEGFLKAYPSRCGNRRPLEQGLHRVRYSVHRFTDYLRQKGLFDPLAQSPVYQPFLDAYLQWMRHYQDASEGTLELRSHSITQFLQWLGPEATPEGLLRLAAERIEKFFLTEHGALRTALHAVCFAGLLTVLFAPRLYRAASRSRCSHPAHLQTGHGPTRAERYRSAAGPALHPP